MEILSQKKSDKNSLIVDEGDPFNKILFDKSINSLKAKGIFKTVKSEIKHSQNKENKIINIMSRKSPQVIFAVLVLVLEAHHFLSIKEKNYLGKGITLDTNFAISDDELRGKFMVVNPNFRI